MKSRLFWKILFGFWITFIAISKGVWVVVGLYEAPRTPPTGTELVQFAKAQLQAASLTLRELGPEAVKTLKSGWRDHDLLTLVETSGAPIENRLPMVNVGAAGLESWVKAVDGKTYRLRYDLNALQVRSRRGPFDTPPELILMAVLGGLLFSAVLAWYLVQPINKLRHGFNLLAQGELGARLQGQVGKRRDEIADLAHDFDQMAERLEQLVASRDRLLHDVSHELRSPLARMQIAVALARQNPQKLDAMLDRIEAETARQDEMVGELLTLARLESGAMAFNTPFDLRALLLAIVEDTRFEADSANIRIVTHLLADMQPMVGQPELLRRAFENIIRNAIRFSPQGQAVRISESRDAAQVVIEICDRGPGAPLELLDTMFDPFVRAQSDNLGFGLGLTIARRAIEAHGGKILAYNDEEGGLRVAVQLPLSSESGSPMV